MHDHAHGAGDYHHHHHDHDHDHPHDHAHDEAGRRRLEARILAKNDALAQKNRGWFLGREILALNLLSSPGAGKTSLIERTITDLADEMKLHVVEGDQATANDAARIAAAGARAVQINTGTGCHLDAEMVAAGLARLRPPPGAVVLIENVGNLVCPALFDLGERAKVVLFAVTEGEDKPVKYPHMFRAADLVLLNKIDLLPHLDFDVDRAVANLRKVNPEAPVVPLSVRNGEGMELWLDWLRRQLAAAHEAAFA
ncbi:MAG: hydrogenase nickel incorporation protein HypB [Thiohalocapsa sp.]